MPFAWNQWVGQVADGQFPLLRYLGGSEQGAVFLTERPTGERSLKAAIKLIPAVPENDELQLSRWRLAAKLSHPHLIPLLEMGRCELDHARLLYVVMEFAEETLAEVLPSRALTPAETRAMLEPILEVLAYAHGKGFVHGRIKPANIMANGDQLKMSSDGMRRIGEPCDGPGTPDAYAPPENSRGVIPVTEAMSPAGDVWSLGVTLVETLTQTRPGGQAAGQTDYPSLPEGLPEPFPFLDVARHCLIRNPQARWTVAEIAARLQGRRPVPQVPLAKHPTRSTTARSQKPHKKRRSYAVPIAAGLLLAGILAGAKLFRQPSEPPQPPAAGSAQVTAPLAPARQEIASPVPASTRLESAGAEERARAGGNSSAGVTVRGEVLRQILPEVPQSASDTIRGTVVVTVRVSVDPSGNVENAELESPGPSRYFARLALQAAQRWRFKPPTIAGRNVVSSWTLRFGFTQTGVKAIPTQEIL